MLKPLTVLIVAACSVLQGWSQFPPAAGQAGSTALPADSSIFIAWATSCSVQPGPMDSSSPGLGVAQYGTDADATGQPDNLVVSLGDGGTATLFFDMPISNGPGWDFAVFENSFSDAFLELCFVEVSSDGNHFVRFPAVSLTQTNNQVATFGTLDPTKIHNFGGKYRALFGTPFNLDDLADSSGIDLNHIVAIRLVDVIGSIDPEFASYDSHGNIVNDPWPTAFPSGGFDLDAVGVIHQASGNQISTNEQSRIQIYPQPARTWLNFSFSDDVHVQSMYILSLSGRTIKKWTGQPDRINIAGLAPGMYCLRIYSSDGVGTKKIIVH